MRIIKNIVIALIVLVAALGIIGMLLPKAYKVERTAVISAPAEVIFDQVNDLKKMAAWSPWKDPEMTVSYGAITAGKGASSSWTSKKMGNGTQTIEESTPNEAIRTNLDFGGRGTAKTIWTFTPEGDAIRVTETMTGEQSNPYFRYMSMMMDKMVGTKFEEGLASLKQVSETEAARLKTEKEQAATQTAAATEEPAAPAAAPAKAAKAK